jgi:hypothetical protein
MVADDPPIAGQTGLPARQDPRRPQRLGAVAIKNAVHAPPAREQAQDDFEWLPREIRDGGGEALICEFGLGSGASIQIFRPTP